MRVVATYLLGLFIIIGGVALLITIVAGIAYGMSLLPLIVWIVGGVIGGIMWLLGEAPYEVGKSLLNKKDKK